MTIPKTDINQPSAEKAISPKLAARPYPKQWERKKTLTGGGSILLRPVKPEDESLLSGFIQKCDPEDIRQRLFEPLRVLPHDVEVLFTRIDYARTMVFVAIDEKTGELLGIIHLISASDSTHAEYAVMTRSDVKKHGVGLALTELLIDYARAEGVDELWGQIMRDNRAMLKICQDSGVQVVTDPSDPIYLLATLRLK